MVTVFASDVSHSDILASVIAQVLTPCQLTMVRELDAAGETGKPAPEELLFWMRLNMPVAAERIETILYPAD